MFETLAVYSVIVLSKTGFKSPSCNAKVSKLVFASSKFSVFVTLITYSLLCELSSDITFILTRLIPVFNPHISDIFRFLHLDFQKVQVLLSLV